MSDPITPEPLCEGLAPFRCGNPFCPAHGVAGPTTEALDPETAQSIIASLQARLDAVSDLADHLAGNEAAPLIREALNGYTPTRPTTEGASDPENNQRRREQ